LTHLQNFLNVEYLCGDSPNEFQKQAGMRIQNQPRVNFMKNTSILNPLDCDFGFQYHIQVGFLKNTVITKVAFFTNIYLGYVEYDAQAVIDIPVWHENLQNKSWISGHAIWTSEMQIS